MCPFGLDVFLRSKFAFWAWDPRYSKRALLLFFFFFFLFSRVSEWCGYCSCTVAWTVTANVDFPLWTVIHALFTNPQIPLFSNFFIKNGFYGTSHTFKKYFTTVFSVSVFSFSKNKLNPNRPIITRIFTHFFTHK